jgi:tripartite-type tricarboxylate transporter receptor subunit TctC
MVILQRIAGLSLALAAQLAPAGAYAQDFPARAVRIVTADVGSTNDVVTRLLAQGLTANLGQQMIVENRGGASGVVAAQAVAKAPGDGYTVLFYSSTVWQGPLLQDLNADATRELAPVALLATSPNILTVHPSLPVKSVKELIALAKRRPGELNYASTSTGASNHIGAELFKSRAGINIVRINYKGGGAALNAQMAGQVQVAFITAGSATPFVKSGRLRALAISTLKPSALAPELPTLEQAADMPGFESASTYASFLPAKTPPALVTWWNQQLLRAMTRDDVKERFLNVGVEATGSSPAQLAATIKSDIAILTRLVKDGTMRGEP